MSFCTLQACRAPVHPPAGSNVVSHAVCESRGLACTLNNRYDEMAKSANIEDHTQLQLRDLVLSRERFLSIKKKVDYDFLK